LKPAWTSTSGERPYLEKTQEQKRAGGMAQSVGPEFKSQYCRKKTTLKNKSLKTK
jgi:hypothetical protein